MLTPSSFCSECYHKSLDIKKLILQLAESSKKPQKQYNRDTEKDFIDCCQDCWRNLLKGHVDISPGQKAKLAQINTLLKSSQKNFVN